MKKNLRIVSAAAAALLAVAPIAAAGVSTVNAAGVSDVDSTKENLGAVNWGIGALNNNETVNVKPNLLLNAQNKDAGVENSTLTGTITANVGGQDYTALYSPVSTKVNVFRTKDTTFAHPLPNGTKITAGGHYWVGINHLKFNFGAANANKQLTLTLPKDDYATYGTGASAQTGRTLKVKTNYAGVVTLTDVLFNVTAKDLSNVASVYFVNKDLGNVVTSGNITLNANANGESNVATVVAAAKKAYTAYQVNLDNGKNEGIVSLTDDVKDALKKAGITVDANGFFKAPHSFSFNLTANSSVNNASAKLPVTVTFANVAEPKPATVASQSKKIMHGAYLYDNKGVRVPNTAEIHAYDSVTVAMQTTQINGKAYYEVINNGQHTGHFINAGNIDGTSRTLRHNAYVYNTKGHRVKSEGTWKKGTKHTTYGATITVKGHRMFRVAQWRYVKAANF